MKRRILLLRPSAAAAAVVLVLFSTSQAQQQQQQQEEEEQDCTLPCEQNAPCTFTTADEYTFDDGNFPASIERTRNGMHCLCPHGWTGVLCDIPYETCDGNHPCLHGGSCVPGLVGPFGNDQLFCNCEHAVDDTNDNDNDNNIIRYVGKFCETAVPLQSSTSTSTSNEQQQQQQQEAVTEGNYDLCDEAGTFFCVNGGTCNPDFPSAGEPCTCPQEYFGEHCEYERGTVPDIDCNLACENGGKCVLGEMPYDQLKHSVLRYNNNNTNGLDHMHCSCPTGYDGELCEYQREPCGEDSYCFHGGKCIERQVDGGMVVHHCDCSATATASATEISDAYAGRFCQFRATSYCTRNVDLNEHLFCVNGGRCRENPKEGCDCDESYAGFSCEFVKSTFASESAPGTDIDDSSEPAEYISDPPEAHVCNLDCQNDGVCRNGIKDLSYLGDIPNNAPHLNQTDDGFFMHCVCPDGYTGVYCEELIEECGDGEHLCLHGSTCVRDGEYHSCDCSTTTSTTSETFAGDHCEHPVDDICLLSDPIPGQPLLFCVNGGICMDYVQAGSPHPGCICLDGFYGPHCEAAVNAGSQNVVAPPIPSPPSTYPNQPVGSRPSSSSSTGSSTKSSSGVTPFGLFLAIMSLIAVLAAFGFFLYGYFRKKRHLDDRLTDNLRWASAYRDNPPADEQNIAPRRKSSYLEAYPANVHSSSTDPFATHLAPIQHDDDDDKEEEEEDEKPQVYIGPPRDEDGHELHNVEIL